MANKVVLNNIDHIDLRASLRYGPEHGNAVNVSLVLPTEFQDAARDYPILLRRNTDGALFAVALLGLDKDENLFLAGDGTWQARYVPAVQRRGPFSIAMQQQGETAEPMIHVDLDDPRVGRETGEPLFKTHGGNTPFLDHVADTLRLIHEGIALAPAVYGPLDDAGLIQPIRLELKLGDEHRYDIENFLTIDQAALAALDGTALERLNRAGLLAAAFTLTASLGNLSRLIELKQRKLANDG